jgi:hypothetical protein
MSFMGEATGAAIGTIIFWAAFCGLTLTVCGIASITARIRKRRRRLELERHLHGWNWPPL